MYCESVIEDFKQVIIIRNSSYSERYLIMKAELQPHSIYSIISLINTLVVFGVLPLVCICQELFSSLFNRFINWAGQLADRKRVDL